jgi:hypothetical protein
VGGFSAANLWRIKQFYEAYAKDEKLAPMMRETGWTKNLVIMERCKDSAERPTAPHISPVFKRRARPRHRRRFRR